MNNANPDSTAKQMGQSILLNADLGEGCANDARIMPLVDIANVACGAHAGDHNTMQQTLVQVRKLDILASAHLGYDDRENFGRRSITYNRDAFAAMLSKQLEDLLRIADAEQVAVQMIKPHGALYHDLAVNRELVQAFISTCERYAHRFANNAICYVAADQSEMLREARSQQLKTLSEGFVDRRYNDRGQLIQRSHPGAIISSETEALEQALLIASQKKVRSDTGLTVELAADTLCLHGDSANALKIATAVSAGLRNYRPI